MHVHVGFSTNGEFNTLRVKGHTRPVSVLEIRRLSRAKYARKGYKMLMGMLTPQSESCILISLVFVMLLLTLWLLRAPNGALKMPGLISHVVPRSTQQPQRYYPVYFAHVLTSVLIYIL